MAPLIGATACDACGPGKFQNANSLSCVDCEFGTFTRDQGKTACSTCQPGFNVTAVSAATDCQPCVAGTYNNQSLRMYIPCEYGTFSTLAQTTCYECQPGYNVTSAELATGCQPCVAGTYQNATLRQCIPCDFGTYATLGR